MIPQIQGEGRRRKGHDPLVGYLHCVVWAGIGLCLICIREVEEVEVRQRKLNEVNGGRRKEGGSKAMCVWYEKAVA